MEYQDQLKLQAYLDGELPQSEAQEVASWLAQDREATALADELRQTRQALAGFEQGMKLPETREFFWSKIRRELQRQESLEPEPSPVVPLLARLRRFLIPAAGFAVVVMAAVLVTGRSPVNIQTSLEDSGAFTYHDFSSGTTLVWLSYPAKNEPADEDELGILE